MATVLVLAFLAVAWLAVPAVCGEGYDSEEE